MLEEDKSLLAILLLRRTGTLLAPLSLSPIDWMPGIVSFLPSSVPLVPASQRRRKSVRNQLGLAVSNCLCRVLSAPGCSPSNVSDPLIAKSTQKWQSAVPSSSCQTQISRGLPSFTLIRYFSHLIGCVDYVI